MMAVYADLGKVRAPSYRRFATGIDACETSLQRCAANCSRVAGTQTVLNKGGGQACSLRSSKAKIILTSSYGRALHCTVCIISRRQSRAAFGMCTDLHRAAPLRP
jgi:hypothetical protein